MNMKAKLGVLLLPLLFSLLLVGCFRSQPLLEDMPEISSIPADQAGVSGEDYALEIFAAGQEFGPAQSWDAALGDFDGDGSLDIFIASLDPESNKIWINDGYGTFSLSGQALEACARGAVGDLNGDGALDLVLADWDPGKELWTDTMQIWLNDGEGIFEQTDALEVGSGTHSLALGDLDGDGDQDLMAVGSGHNSVWLNQGGGKFQETDQELIAGIDAAIGLGDLDADGDLDALSGGWEGLPSVWLNDGSGRMERVEQAFSDPDLHIHGLALGDLDNDGDLDVFLVLANGSPHQIWENDGKAGFSIMSTVPGPLGHDIGLGDLDQDGDLDAVTAHGHQSGGDLRLWINDGSGTFSQADFDLGEDFTTAIALGDLDLDGDLDIISAASDWENDPGPLDRIWINPNRFQPQAGKIEIRKADGMAMLYVPGGEFLMGGSESDQEVEEGELPRHTVYLDAFWIDQTEVTNQQYNLCVSSGKCAPAKYNDSEKYNGTDYPAVGVSWQDAQDYCAWAGGRLPTEAEWEYAAKGPESKVYPWGNQYDGLLVNGCDLNCPETWADQVVDDGFPLSAPVGSFPGGASWVGAYDLAGNVWEWVWDWCEEYSAEPLVNPVGPGQGSCKIIRGGAWASPPAGLRTTYRIPNTRDIKLETRHPNIGFRCVLPAME